MTDYTELVKALRWNGTEYKGSTMDEEDKEMYLDAADAIEALNRLVDINTERCEALRKQLREAQEQYEKHLNELEKELSFSESTYEEFQITAATQNALLAKKLPKRGEWKTTDAFPHRVYCSNCFRTYVPNDRWQIWADKPGEGGLERNYCPSCGAKMEVQDGYK